MAPVRHPPEARMVAVSIMRRVHDGHITFKEAAHIFREQWNDTTPPPERPVSRVPDFLNHWWERWQQHASIEDAHGTGRTPKVPAHEARLLAAEFKRGQQLPPDAEGMPQLPSYYTSVKDACERNPAFAKALVTWRCTTHTLLRAMLHADPSIRLRTITYKKPFKAGYTQLRQERAQDMLQHCSKDELCCVFFGDAASIVIDSNTWRQHVYCDPTDPALQLVREAPMAADGQPVTIKFFVWVNALLGVVACHILSGSTDLDRGDLWRPQVMRHKPYMVSMV